MDVLQGKLSAFSPVSLVLKLCIIIFVCMAFTIVLIGASLSEPHTGGSLSWFHTSHVWTLRMMKYD